MLFRSHELCHAAPAFDDDTGEQKVDAADRLVWRTRKHDIEEFRSVVTNHGCYKRDLMKFAEALLKKKETPIIPGLEPSKPKRMELQ